MVKTRFTEEKRNVVHSWMMEQYEEKQKKDSSVEKLRLRAITEINKVLRKKFSEDDMVILRKYGCAKVDNCIKLVNSETNQVFGVEFSRRRYGEPENKKPETEGLADIPYNSGCGVYPISPRGQEVVEAFIAAKEKAMAERKLKSTQYRSFLSACRYVEDAHSVVPFPKEMQDRLFSGGAVIAINEELIQDIKKEFAA